MVQNIAARLSMVDRFTAKQNNKRKRDLVGCFTFNAFLQSFCYKCVVTLPHGAMDWSAVCVCGISCSHSHAY